MPAGWGKDPEDWDELAAAKDSYYYWWWAFLRESDEYRQARKGETVMIVYDEDCSPKHVKPCPRA